MTEFLEVKFLIPVSLREIYLYTIITYENISSFFLFASKYLVVVIYIYSILMK